MDMANLLDRRPAPLPRGGRPAVDPGDQLSDHVAPRIPVRYLKERGRATSAEMIAYAQAAKPGFTALE